MERHTAAVGRLDSSRVGLFITSGYCSIYVVTRTLLLSSPFIFEPCIKQEPSTVVSNTINQYKELAAFQHRAAVVVVLLYSTVFIVLSTITCARERSDIVQLILLFSEIDKRWITGRKHEKILRF